MNQSNNEKNTIEDYLTGPRKKKRDYVILASNSNHTNELKANIYDFCRKFYPSHIFNHVYSTDELSKSVSIRIFQSL